MKFEVYIMKFVMLLSVLGSLMGKTLGLPIHTDHKKTGEVYINNTKYNMLTPVYHITEEGPKTGIRLHNVATRKVFVDGNGVRHSWINIKDYKLSRKTHKRQIPKMIEENGLIEANEIEEATDVVELFETVTEQTDDNPDESGVAQADQGDATTDVVETTIKETNDNPDQTGATAADEDEETTDVKETATEQTYDDPDETGATEDDEDEEDEEVTTDMTETVTEQTADNPDENGAAEGDENKETTDVIETTTEKTDDNPDASEADHPPKLRQLRAETTKATTKKPVKTTKKPTTTPPLQKLTYVKTTFFCPFLGVFTTNHYNYEIVNKETTVDTANQADATTKKAA